MLVDISFKIDIGKNERTICRLLKCESISQLPENAAVGVPQPEGLGFPLVMSEGVLDLEKNQILMPEDVHSVA